ncbi:MAG: FtsW/RodA/SpoVE family cell cycle protein [Bacteroidaceae bacterium]|nr:FtsW/RodA/SpoVE family cell cycle protein [Bacteroidaceae bacterium]
MKVDNIKERLFQGDKIIWIVFFIICAISGVEVFSATSRQISDSGSYWSPVIRHLMFLAAGIFIIWFINLYSIDQVKKIGKYFYLAGVAGIIWAQFDSSSQINGSARWISLGFITFQPMEFVKLGLVMLTAKIIAGHQDSKGTKETALISILKLGLLPILIILKENLSTAFILSLTLFLMLFIAKAPWKQMLKVVGICTAIGVVGICAIMLTPDSVAKGDGFGNKVITWKNRIKDMGNSDPIDPATYQIVDDQRAHANMAIASSHLIGCGPGNSVQRDNIPHAYSDFIYAIILEELGLIGGIFVLLLYLTLLYRCGKIANRCEKMYPAMLAIGIGIIIVSQAMLHMYISVGDFVTGQPLPLISQGGTSVMINCVYIGILLCISKDTIKKKSIK